MDFDLESLELELTELGASHLQRELFEMNVPRARAAIAEATNRGAGNRLSYALSLFRSEGFSPEPKRKPRPVNVHGRIDPTRTDEGKRIWQADEVDDVWRAGYLTECWQALHERREPTTRYQPSEAELDAWMTLMLPPGFSTPISLEPRTLETTAERALQAWAELWGVLLPELERQPVPEREPDPWGLAWRLRRDAKFRAEYLAEHPELAQDEPDDDPEPMLDDPEPVLA